MFRYGCGCEIDLSSGLVAPCKSHAGVRHTSEPGAWWTGERSAALDAEARVEEARDAQAVRDSSPWLWVLGWLLWMAAAIAVIVGMAYLFNAVVA